MLSFRSASNLAHPPFSMRVLIAPDKFKSSLSAADALADGWPEQTPGD